MSTKYSSDNPFAGSGSTEEMPEGPRNQMESYAPDEVVRRQDIIRSLNAEAFELQKKMPFSVHPVQIVVRKLLNALAVFGLTLIAYGVMSEATDNHWPLIEKYANGVSSVLTIVGAAATAASIYFWRPLVHEPEWFSRKISGPLVILLSAGSLVYFSATGSIPAYVVNGFALLAIAGGLFRVQWRTGE